MLLCILIFLTLNDSPRVMYDYYCFHQNGRFKRIRRKVYKCKNTLSTIVRLFDMR